MKFDTRRIMTKAVAVTALFCMTTQTTFAALLNLATDPLAVTQVPPKVMLAISKDQQLYKKAYNDYTDLDGDGTIETNYKHTIEYYGYFDPFKCYQYVNHRFEPAAKTLDKMCGGAHWSGNFLNWVAMARVDAVRKLLYGGLRETDETFDAKLRPNPITVLERSYLPTDAHSWAKHYNPDPSKPDYNAAETPDIGKLTPFGSDTSTTATVAAATVVLAVPVPARPGDVSILFSATIPGVSAGDQLELESKIAGSPGSVKAAVVSVSATGLTYTVRLGGPNIMKPGNWQVTNLSTPGISFCNTTVGSTDVTSANHRSSTNTNPPLIRVVKGNFALWNANETWQCQWQHERNNTQGNGAGRLRSNGNQAAFSEINASAENPSQTAHGIGVGSGAGKGEFNARVVVCDPKFFDESRNKENCKKYPNGNLKPIGLLQEYGDNGRFEFGLMTGSYARNISGGVLRKNPASLKDEVNVDTDGTFREAHSDGVVRSPYRPRGGKRNMTSAESPAGIINTLSYMRIYGYQHATGKYDGTAGDACKVQLTSLTENTCTSWGNPMSEIFLESVRYFAGKDANYAYTLGNSKDNELGLPLAKHVDSLNTKETYCANLNVLMFNAANADNDDDLGSVSAEDINAGKATIADLTNIVGNASNEAINGKPFFVGTVKGATPDAGFELCTAKTVDLFSNASGICPEGPTTQGSYMMAGIAYHAKTKRIRPDIAKDLPPASDPRSFKVSTFAVQLASNTPQLEIKGSGGERVVIQPIYRLDLTGLKPPAGVGGGGLVDMRYVKIENTKTNSKGKVYVNWEDSEQGGDYDQDMWGTIEWNLDVAKGEITITTDAISAATGNPQGFGYSISGTIYDGPHFHSGILNFNYTDPFTAVDPKVIGCTNCNLRGVGGQVGPRSVTYKLGGGAVAKLQDPMWYTAKYGGFKDNNEDGTPKAKAPTSTEEWDSENNATGKPGADGTPDNYFLVTNPLQLVVALRTALAKLGGNSTGTAALADSTSLSTTNFLFQARYEPIDWSGQLLARKVDPKTGEISPDEPLDAGKQLNTLAADKKRVILTFDNKTTHDGVAFTYDTIPTALKDSLNVSPVTKSIDDLGAQRLAWLRGDQSLELQNQVGGFRNRTRSVLGDIANSDPTYVGVPNAPRREASYGKFRRDNFNRTPMLYVGANDGMVHGFDAVDLKEKIAFIPSKTHANLSQLTAPSYTHRFYVDGPTEAADAIVNDDWRTVLVGGLGGGGQGVYALDVTDPSKFSESTAATHVMWEFNDTHDKDLGYVYGKPVVREMANGKWAVIFSGGYNNSEPDGAASDNGRAYLFILYLTGPTGGNGVWQEGVDYFKIDTGAGSKTTPNGLAPPFVADVDGDGKTDFAYAGDLEGNLWKFDLRLPKVKAGDPAPDPKGYWPDPKNRALLFTARETDDDGSPRQPITAQAEGTAHPTRQGFVIVVGTGQYLETEDTGPRRPGKTFQPQHLYGIWDKNVPAPISDQAIVKRDTLFTQAVADVTTAAGRQVRVFPLKSPDWSTDFGWKIEFPNSKATGERSVFRLLITARRLIFTTLIPLGEPCAGGGSSYLYIIDPATGAGVDGPVFDLNGDGILNSEDQVSPGVYASGIKTDVGITPPPVVVKGGPTTAASDNASKVFGSQQPGVVGGSGSVLAFTFLGGPLGIQGMWIGLGANSGRVSWREILTQ